MSGLARFMVHDATLLRPNWDTDRYGDTVANWTTPERIAVRGWFTRVDTTEFSDGREAITANFSYSLPADTPVEVTDRVERDDVVCEIIGGIGRAETPEGTHHLVLQLRSVRG